MHAIMTVILDILQTVLLYENVCCTQLVVNMTKSNHFCNCTGILSNTLRYVVKLTTHPLAVAQTRDVGQHIRRRKLAFL